MANSSRLSASSKLKRGPLIILLIAAALIGILVILFVHAGGPTTVYDPQGDQTNGYYTGGFTIRVTTNCFASGGGSGGGGAVGLKWLTSPAYAGGSYGDVTFNSNSLGSKIEGDHIYSFYSDENDSAYYTFDNENIKPLYGCGPNPGTTFNMIRQFTLRVDTAAPGLTVTSPADGTHTTQALLPVTGNVSDAGSGPDHVIIRGVTVGTSGSFNYNASLSYGANAISIVGYDKAGHASPAINVSVYRDQAGSTPPPAPPAAPIKTSGSNPPPPPATGASTTLATTQPTGAVTPTPDQKPVAIPPKPTAAQKQAVAINALVKDARNRPFIPVGILIVLLGGGGYWFWLKNKVMFKPKKK